MATFVFENMTQAQANAFAAGDVLAFSTTSVNAFNITVTPSPQNDTLQVVTLTANGKSLSFDQVALSASADANLIAFFDGSLLNLGTFQAEAGGTAITNGDIVYLFGGDDVYAADDTGVFVYGGAGADSIVGGEGADHLYGQSANGGTDSTDSITGGNGNDYIQGNAGNDLLDGGNGSDRIQGGNGNDTINDTGDGNDSINGNLGNDTINGGTGNDSIRGGQGNDSLLGGAGNDTLVGDKGNDQLVGGADADLLQGGEGNDVFVFGGTDATVQTVASVAYYDTVLDFTDGSDLFRITGGTGTTGIGDTTGEVVIGASTATFTAVSAATSYAQQLLDANTGTVSDVAIVKVGGDTYLFYDSTVSTGTIDSIIKLQGITDTSIFTTADFAG